MRKIMPVRLTREAQEEEQSPDIRFDRGPDTAIEIGDDVFTPPNIAASLYDFVDTPEAQDRLYAMQSLDIL